MTALLHSDAKSVLNVLLLHLSTHRARILAGVKILAGIKQTISLESEEHIVSLCHISTYVCTYVLAY